MGSVTAIDWTATAAPQLAGLSVCPLCNAALLDVDGALYHPGATFNPWWGCSKVSEGCEHCYAEAMDRRVGGDHWGPHVARREMLPAYWQNPYKWARHLRELGIRIKVFPSMCDPFESDNLELGTDRRQLSRLRGRLWALIEQTPELDWLLLTKRPENAPHMLPDQWRSAEGWRPYPRNLWLGVSAENQRWAESRIPRLLKLPAARRFVSYEPALGPVDLSMWLRARRHCNDGHVYTNRSDSAGGILDASRLDWVIAGAESGGKARRCDPAWVRSVRDQCDRAQVAFFLKQFATPGGKKIRLPVLDGLRHVEQPQPRS